MKDFKQTALGGAGWTFSAQGFTFVFQIVSVSILARLLEPEDFGLIGMLASVLAVLGLLRQTGLSTAIIQRKELRDGDLVRLWHASVILGVGLAAAVIVAGVGVSWLMDDARLSKIAPWYGLSFFFGALETVPTSLLRRRMEFRRIAIRDGLSLLLGNVAAITSACLGAGYWALVIGPVCTAFVNMVVNWWAAGWWPRGAASTWREVLPYLGFGGAFTASGVAAYFTQHLDSVLIGKLWGYEALGFYTRARTLMLNPLGQVMGPIGSVLIPVLSRIRDDRDRFKRWIDSLANVSLLCSGPLAALMMVVSPDIILLLLGPGWERSIGPFRWLAVALYFLPFGSLLYWVLTVSGRIRLLLHWTWTGALITVVAIGFGALRGPMVVAAAYSLSGLLIRIFVAIHYAGRTGLIDPRVLVRKYAIGMIHAVCWLGYLSVISHYLGEIQVSGALHLAGLTGVWLLTAVVLLFGTAWGRRVVRSVRDVMPSIPTGASR